MKPKAQILFLKVDRLIKNYGYDLAFQKLNEIYKLDSENANILNCLGWVYDTKLSSIKCFL